MERLKLTVSGNCYITIECENPERARQVARWLMGQIEQIPHPQSTALSDEAMSTIPKGRGQNVATRAAQNRSKRKGGAAGGAASRQRATSR
jgi:hypothetical protein